ncbi:Glycosyl transferases group 1 [Clostridiales bacterium CHKCI006]|nr:Glycosyl transferases group 1 [Clostridiales bacterium CHKCI006]
MKKVVIISKHDIGNAYSCLQYLAKGISDKYDVHLWSCTEKENMDLVHFKNHKSFLLCWYGNLKAIRLLFMYFHVFIMCAFFYQYIILNDIDFFPFACIPVKIFKKKKLVLYNTEIYGKDVKTFPIIEKSYQKNVNLPDLNIECLEQRKKYRLDHYKLKRPITVINNTLPYKVLSNLPITKKEDYIPSKYNSKKILIYAGGCNLERNLGRFIEELSTNQSIFFLAFCYGTPEQIENVKHYCKLNFTENNWSINNAISREKLLSIMMWCDIGINYYDPAYSLNHKYAAPSKFFEYIACGLNIISTNNEGINKIINEEKIGICLKEKETLSVAINRLLQTKFIKKEEIKRIFREKYCYEIDSQKAIQSINELFD